MSVCGHDIQGSGFSESLHGVRSYFESFDDLLAATLQMRRCNPLPLPPQSPARGLRSSFRALLNVSCPQYGPGLKTDFGCDFT